MPIQMTKSEYTAKYGVSPSISSPVKMTRSEYQSTYGQPVPSPEPEKKKSVFGKVAEFIAPTTTRTFEKLKSGTKPSELTGRDIIGSGLEIGSFLLPVGAIGRGLGLAGKGALTLGKKIALGSVTGAASAGTFEAGRAIGEEGTTAGEIASRTLGGAAFGAGFGVALPLGFKVIPKVFRATPKVAKKTVAGAKVIPKIFRATPKVAKKTVEGLKKTTTAVKGIGTGIAETAGRVPRRAEQFFADRTELATKMGKAPSHVKEALKMGIEDPVIDLVRNTSKTDKLANAKMLDMAVKGKNRFVLRPEEQAKTIAGKTIMQGPVTHLIKVKDKSILKTNQILNSLGAKKQNARPVFDQFLSEMKTAGVVPTSKGKLVTMRGSKIPENDLKFYQQVFNELVPNKGGKVPLTFHQLHGLRQKWFDIAKSDKTFTGGPTSYARHLRALLAQPIDQASKGKYLLSQNTTREAIDGLQDTLRLMGHKGKLQDITTRDLKAGEVFLRAFGNAADRPNAVLQKLYSTARKYKYKGTEDPLKQLKFADFLEDVYGSPQTRALRSQVGRGVSDADPASRTLSAFREAVKWSSWSAVARLGRNIIAKRPEDAIRVFENMVRKEAGLKIPTTLGKPKTLIQIGKETVDEIKKGVKKETVFGKKKVDKTTQKGVISKTTKPEMFGAFGGIEQDDKGKITFSPEKAALGVGAIAAIKKGQGLGVFKGLKDLTLKTVEKLKGKTTVSKQFISDLTNAPDLKQAERDLIRGVLKEMPDGKINVTEFANKVKTELLPLKVSSSKVRGYGETKYENISLPAESRGNIVNYDEHIYNSPIKTTAGDIHFSNQPNYFAHTRIEDMAKKDTRRVIELQSDLFQKGRLKGETLGGYSEVEHFAKTMRRNKGTPQEIYDRMLRLDKRKIEERFNIHNLDDFNKVVYGGNYEKLQPYRNTWHERVIKEEIKQAAKDGKTKLQFPTGETAMQVEGLGGSVNTRWRTAGNQGLLKVEDLKVGSKINSEGQSDWIITDVLGDGKFKAINPNNMNKVPVQYPEKGAFEITYEGKKLYGYEQLKETFDISRKVDTSNPIYRFYEKEVQRYLKRIEPNMKRVTDEQGVTWFELPISKEKATEPITAFGKAKIGALIGGASATGGLATKSLVPSDKVQYQSKEPEKKKPTNTLSISKGLAYAETRGVDKPYSFSQWSNPTLKEKSPLGKALGKYQITEARLKEKSKDFLGSVITPKEFLENKSFQEKFIKKQIDWLRENGLTDDEIIAVHRHGWGNMTKEQLKKAVKERGEYLGNVRKGMEQNDIIKKTNFGTK